MKTNIVMQSGDRSLFGITIRQETKTGFLNVSDLTVAYETERAKKGWAYRRADEIFDSNTNAERIYYILKKRGYFKDVKYDSEASENKDTSIKGNILPFMENSDNQECFIKWGIPHFMKDVKDQGIKKVLKSLKAYKTTGRGDNKSVSCDPYIWMLIAMELHPEIYAHAVCWLADTLLTSRIEAGTMYPALCKSLSKFENVDYSKVGEALNYVVFGKHETGIRNTATQEQLKELNTLESNLTYSISMGYINSFDRLIEEMRVLYHKKWGNLM